MVDNGVNKFDETVGLLKRATIVNYLPDQGIMQVKLASGQQSIKGQSLIVPINIPAPHAMFYNNGLFIGTLPSPGTPVVIGQGTGGQYHFVSFLAENLSLVPKLTVGELLIAASDDTKITLSNKDHIYIGSDANKIHIDTTSNLITTSFESENHFTQASRKVNGVIKRDIVRNTKMSQNNKLESDNYDSFFKVIGMDPKSTANSIISGSSKNPPFVESREIVYEFQYSSNINDDLREASRYGTEKATPLDLSFPNRRVSRADTLSLSLVSPNYLIETVKGTVVDIYGNILDLNRAPLPVGQDQNTINKDKSSDKTTSFLLIKEIERKSLAYHFEINARKDLSANNGLALPDVNSSDDYSRARSRFFFDVDKEGQFKLNVPASSEKGNIPLLTRYENYSTFGTDSPNPDKLVYNGAGNDIDVYQDSFASSSLSATGGGFLPSSDGARGSITLMTGDGANAAPQDRLTGQHIKHGMVYHDIMQTCFAHQNQQFISYPSIDILPGANIVEPLTNIAKSTITTTGSGANAGGRSGSLNFDGSLEFNIGANTSDRQSLWLDTAGGMVANIGRDINGRSIVAATGGDFYLQVGGFGVTGDSRFVDQNNGIKGAVLDLRILGAGGYTHMIRIDDKGISIMSPGDISMHAKGVLSLSSDTSIILASHAITMKVGSLPRPVLPIPISI
jgi:hypothetical protein